MNVNHDFLWALTGFHCGAVHNKTKQIVCLSGQVVWLSFSCALAHQNTSLKIQARTAPSPAVPPRFSLWNKWWEKSQFRHVHCNTCWTGARPHIHTHTHTHRRGVRKQVSVPLICSEPCGDSAENQPVECVVCMPEIVPGESRRTVDSGTKNVDYPLSLVLNGTSYLFHFFWPDYFPRSSAAEPVKPCVCAVLCRCCREG